jgi:hypothetical protein
MLAPFADEGLDIVLKAASFAEIRVVRLIRPMCCPGS